jgi:hypothetical protein
VRLLARESHYPQGPMHSPSSPPPPAPAPLVASGKERPKKKKRETRDKKTIPKNNRPTFLFFFPFFLGAPCVGCGPSVDIPPHVGTRSWLWGLPLRASSLVPSDGPFMWCLYETFFVFADFLIFSNGHFCIKILPCLVLYMPRAGRTLPAGEGGCATGSLAPSHRPK